MDKKKLQLKKRVVASLSDADLKKVMGGGNEYTTSNSDCTHLLCCHDDCTPPVDPLQTKIGSACICQTVVPPCYEPPNPQCQYTYTQPSCP